METEAREGLPTSALAPCEHVPDRNVVVLSTAAQGKSILIAAGPKQDEKENWRCVS